MTQAWNKGIKTPQHVREKQSVIAKTQGRKPPVFTGHSEESKRKISVTLKESGHRPPIQYGEQCWNWQNGRSQDAAFYNRTRRNRKLNAEGSHTKEEWENLKAKYNHMCLCCKLHEPEISLTEDHIIPLTKNGTDYIDNIQPLCKPCNSRKYDKIINFSLNQHELTR